MRGKSKSIVFPAARIKRIMRINEQVGKIAVPTPVLVSKALQMMLQDFLTSCCQTAQEHSSTVITPHLMEHCIKNYDRFAFLLKLLSSKQKLESLPLEGGRELSYNANERDTLDLMKETLGSRKRTNDVSRKRKKKERSMTLNSFNFQDWSSIQSHCSHISPRCVSLKTEAQEDNYDCDEEESKTTLLNASSSVNDSPLIDDPIQSTGNVIIENKQYKESSTQYDEVKHEQGKASKAENEDEYRVVVIEDTAVLATCSSSSLSESDLYSLDKTGCSSRLFISIEELVDSHK
ncbi:hypothetical protein GpartN1_g5486.t1 [Galdieria partita]|uniref:Transcription factor CBF/NF-Y/archaeal histone domain-containing protein n=1 Tax=Galdieria partita TaxID=83374 RepID=A0A9C7Q099_9RHOD|nr:hypothetical protein GpartN1_g5486.t1 [Galdieria partita]